MSISINGIAHLQMNVSPGRKALEFWGRLCHFLEMETLLQGEDSRYFISGRTGILVHELDHAHADQTFDQNTTDAPNHTLCPARASPSPLGLKPPRAYTASINCICFKPSSASVRLVSFPHVAARNASNWYA